MRPLSLRAGISLIALVKMQQRMAEHDHVRSQANIAAGNSCK